MNTDLLNAMTGLVRAVAWPLVALVAMWWFRPELRVLLGRFRRAAGVEFDPPPATQANTVTVPTMTTLSAELGQNPNYLR
jgi:hypothetical protein